MTCPKPMSDCITELIMVFKENHSPTLAAFLLHWVLDPDTDSASDAVPFATRWSVAACSGS